MVDIDLIAKTLRDHGHTVEHVHQIPANAGAYEFTVDGRLLTLEQARELLEREAR
jgi:hypothetical protein